MNVVAQYIAPLLPLIAPVPTPPYPIFSIPPLPPFPLRIMSPASSFTGLSMSVFTAFGWAGELNALKFALGQLHDFIHTLRPKLGRDAQRLFAHCGLDEESRTVYLAINPAVEEEPHLRFAASPSYFEMRLSITQRTPLVRGLKTAEADAVLWHRQVAELGTEWQLHIQQFQVDEETGSMTNYQDVFKGGLAEWDLQASTAATSRALFLNNDPRWLATFHLYRRWKAEPISIMGEKLIGVMSQEVDRLMPVVTRFALPLKPAANKRRGGRAPRPQPVAEQIPTPISQASPTAAPTQFTYTAELKPLHIRKGFINLTAEHWPFFTDSVRLNSRPVTLYYAGKYDKETTVWRLQPEEIARIVLGEKVQGWFAKTFDGRTQVKVTATKLPQDEIQINLSQVE